jgi:glycosyltransferase involved in cell wall biosynthesis
MKQDKISVIMPCFNAEAFLSISIKSALDQTFKNIELIVINDGSTDNSLQILNGLNDTRLKIINQLNRGVCAARNRGLAEATGNYIAFLDADDTWRPDCLEKLHSELRSRSDAVLAYCGWQNVGLPGGRGEPYVPPDYEDESKLEYLLRGCPWPIHAALMRRSAIESAGCFDERLSNAEDYKLWLQIASLSKIVRVPEVLAFYHFHQGQQASKNRAKAAYHQWVVQKEFIQKNPEIVKQLGYKRVRQLINGELLKKGYICYWERDLRAAREIFRIVMKQGYGRLKDWKYMLPSLLPVSLHNALIRFFERSKAATV